MTRENIQRKERGREFHRAALFQAVEHPPEGPGARAAAVAGYVSSPWRPNTHTYTRTWSDACRERADKDQMRALLRRRRRYRDIAPAGDALETVGGGGRQDIQDMGVPGDPRARCDITQPPQSPSSVGSGRSASNSDTDSGGGELAGHSEELLRQYSGFKMKCLAATIMAACAWNIVRSEDRGGPNGPMSSKEYTVGGHGKEVVCYWGTWANYRPGNGKFTPEDIDPSLCTNVIYSFAGLDSETNSIKSLGRPGALPASSVAAKFSIHAVIERIQLAAPSNGGAQPSLVHVELSTTLLTALGSRDVETPQEDLTFIFHRKQFMASPSIEFQAALSRI